MLSLSKHSKPQFHAAYNARKRHLALTGLIRGIADSAVTAYLIADPLERRLRVLPRALRAPAFIGITLLLDTVRDLPIGYIENFAIERDNDLSQQPVADWFADSAKGTAIALAVMLPLTMLGELVIRRAPRRWPWLALAGTPPLLALATVIAPTFIMPLFNAYEPIGGELEARIRELAARYGVGNASILRFDLSRRTVRANAFVTGVLGTERIVLGDTLIENFPDDETMFVVAHELGHYVRRDPWLGIALGTALLGITLVAANGALRRTSGRGLDDAAQGARFAFFAGLLQVALMPVGASVSRAMERRADRFAARATGNPTSGAAAFRRLGQQNHADPSPPRWAQVLFGSHPTLDERVRTLEAI
jgi:STE24 endopeptidase